MKNEPLDKTLWNKIKKQADKIYKKPSAYKSGYITKLYKESGGKFKNKKTKDGLTRWFKEKWTNERGETWYKYKSDIYRPTIKVSSKTPLTYDELTSKQIKQAKKKKSTKGRVNKF